MACVWSAQYQNHAYDTQTHTHADSRLIHAGAYDISTHGIKKLCGHKNLKEIFNLLVTLIASITQQNNLKHNKYGIRR